MAQPTAHEQYLLELVNRARLDPAGEANRLGIGLNDGLASGTISATPKQPLAFDPLLIDAARGHGEWMLATDTFSHSGAGGSSPGDRMAAAGYAFTGSWTWGENISIRWGGGTAVDAAQVDSFHDGLFRSAGHRKNILSDAFKEIGTGLALGEHKGGTGATATEAFARSGTGSILTGVAFDDKDGDRFYDPGERLGGVTVTITGGGRTWTAATWDAGGYGLTLPAGTYSVAFSGGGLASPIVRSATMGPANVKLDLDADAGGTTPPPPSSPPTGLALVGTTGGDVLRGGAGADTLSGRGGGDTLAGGSGRDALDGGAGSDRLVGGSGVDALTGGTGADRFVCQGLNDRGDIIADFTAAAQGDRLDLSALFGAGTPDTQAGLVAGGFVRLRDSAGGLQVLADADGGGDAFVALATLAGVTTAGLGGAEILVA